MIVTGKLRQRSFEAGSERRMVIEVDVDEVGASLRYTSVKGHED